MSVVRSHNGSWCGVIVVVGWIQDFREGGPLYAVGGSMVILPRKILKTEVLGNGISGIPKPSQRVMLSIF